MRGMFLLRRFGLFGFSVSAMWAQSTGFGTVHATTVVHPQQGETYNVCLVDLDEGFRMMSRVEDIDPTEVKIGMRVKFRVHVPTGDEDPYPVFTPVEAGQ